MLTRLAGNCYWMARYLERAENTCRLLRAISRQTMLPEFTRSTPLFLTALAVTDDLEEFHDGAREVSARAVLAFMLVSRSNPSSVVNCLKVVRENARTVRHALTADYWEAVNTAYLEALELDRDGLSLDTVDRVIDWAIHSCHRIRGAGSDLLLLEVPHVLQLGQAIERTDFTSRLLHTLLDQLHIEDEQCPPDPGTADYRSWLSLLEAADIIETWLRFCPSRKLGARALRLLICNNDTTRSLLTNARAIVTSLERLTDRTTSKAISQAKALEQMILAMPVDDGDDPTELKLDIHRTIIKLWDVSDVIVSEHLSIPEQTTAPAQTPS